MDTSKSMTRSHQDSQLDILGELALNLLRPSIGSPGPSFKQMTPAGFASLLLGISLSMMLCGSLTFLIGFILMPWVLGLVVFLYFAGIVSTISMLGRALLCHTSEPSSPRKAIPSWKLL